MANVLTMLHTEPHELTDKELGEVIAYVNLEMSAAYDRAATEPGAVATFTALDFLVTQLEEELERRLILRSITLW